MEKAQMSKNDNEEIQESMKKVFDEANRRKDALEKFSEEMQKWATRLDGFAKTAEAIADVKECFDKLSAAVVKALVMLQC